MINFEDVFWQNFLSTGNAGTKISLNGAPTTLVIGKNGHGKSTLLDALCFALFGKPFRNITKNQLVNSVNGKACKVCVNFKTEGKHYEVTRGIKPNLFEIKIDGKLLQQDAATKDYQKVLETQILKFNHKTFTQVVILGASSFTPFMKLPAGHRREVIEDILDIKIFSTMGVVLKEKVAEAKTALADINLNIASLKNQIESQRSFIDLMKKSKEDNTADLEHKIDNNNRRIEALEKDLTILEDQMQAKKLELESFSFKEDLEKVNSDIRQKISRLQEVMSELSFFENHDECSVCRQGIDTEHKHEINEKLESERQDIHISRNELKIKQQELIDKSNQFDQCYADLQQLQIDHSGIQSEVRTIRRQTVDYENQIKELSANTGDIDKEKVKLKTLAAAITAMLEEKIELTEKRNLQEVASTLLKDSGIKTNVVREYLPLMNKLINKYLQVQDSFIQFELDEQFEETIKSRYRDEFSYASFSEGERQRIDLSILFTWRQIARMKNSANTNLLILDEVMDGSLDDEGNDSAQDLINALAADGTHVFVVSHSVDKHIDKFARVLKFEKKGNYSAMAELK